jgi:hypothetical protein
MQRCSAWIQQSCLFNDERHSCAAHPATVNTNPLWLPTVHKRAQSVCAYIFIIFHQESIPKPTTEKTTEVEANFGKKANFM